MPFTGNGPATKSDEFLEKCQGGGGVIFNPKTYIAEFQNFKQGFLSMKLIQKKCKFRAQGMFFQQSYWETLPKAQRTRGLSSAYQSNLF